MLKDIAVASGIASLCLAYVLFIYQQLFSPCYACNTYTTYLFASSFSLSDILMVGKYW